MKLTSESKFLLGILVSTVAIIGIAAVLMTRPEKPDAAIAEDVLIPQDAHTKGNPESSVSLVEFSDFQCPACAAFAPTVKQLTDKYQDRLLFAYRHFPLPTHAFAKQAAFAAEAAAIQGKFWEAEALLFANQNKFSDTFFQTEFAKLVELDELAYAKDISSDTVKNIVERDANAATQLNLPGTPTFFLNGIRLKDIFGPEDLVKAVESAIQ